MPALSQAPRAARAAASTGGWVFRDRQAQRMHKFVVLPKGWIASNDGLDQPQSPLGAPFRAIRPIAAFVMLAMIRIRLRRLTQPSPI
jgi:hypothetical protein